MWIIIGFLVVFVLTYDIFLKYAFIYRAKRAGLDHVPVVINWPMGIRNLFRGLEGVRNHTSLETMLKYFRPIKKTTFTEEILGSLFVVTLDPENVKSVLATDFSSYSLGMREAQLNYFLGNGIFTLSGEPWKHSRALLRPQFAREQVAQIHSLRRHVSSLEKHLDRDEFVDIQLLFHQLTMDTATEFLLGESVDSLNNSQRKVNGISAAQFVQDYTLCVEWCLTRIQFGPLYWLVKPKVFRDAIDRSRRFIDYFVAAALELPIDNEKSSYVFTHELAKVTRDPIVIRDQALNILIAGRDTTASLLSYALWHLAHHPEVYQKLRNEILEAFGSEDTEGVTFESLKRCVYLRYVINETLRVNPTVPRNFRFATRDTKLPRGGGPDGDRPVFIPKGTPVFYSVYEIHRRPELWGPDAEEFHPERWETHKSQGWEFLPFNGGPRICLGQQFALTEASFVIMRLCQKYSRIELKDPEQPLANDVNLTSRVYGGVWLKMHI